MGEMVFGPVTGAAPHFESSLPGPRGEPERLAHRLVGRDPSYPRFGEKVVGGVGGARIVGRHGRVRHDQPCVALNRPTGEGEKTRHLLGPYPPPGGRSGGIAVVLDQAGMDAVGGHDPVDPPGSAGPCEDFPNCGIARTETRQPPSVPAVEGAVRQFLLQKILGQGLDLLEQMRILGEGPTVGIRQPRKLHGHHHRGQSAGLPGLTDQRRATVKVNEQVRPTDPGVPRRPMVGGQPDLHRAAGERMLG
jgi:hypothetical protein